MREAHRVVRLNPGAAWREPKVFAPCRGVLEDHDHDGIVERALQELIHRSDPSSASVLKKGHILRIVTERLMGQNQ